MSKAIIDESTLTNLADKIRVLNGTEDTMTPDEMNNELASANNEVDAQSALIDQLNAALEGKASGGNSGELVSDTCSVHFYLKDINVSDFHCDPSTMDYEDVSFYFVFLDENFNIVDESIDNNMSSTFNKSEITITTIRNSTILLELTHAYGIDIINSDCHNELYNVENYNQYYYIPDFPGGRFEDASSSIKIILPVYGNMEVRIAEI